MYKLIATAFVLGGGLYLSACATLNESECQTVDWRQLGDSDGSQGHGQTRLGKHAKACEKHGIAVNTAAYNDGWRAGITRYCTPQNGFNIGRRGGAYAGTCPSHLAGSFEAAYRPAFKLNRAENRVGEIQNGIDKSIDNLARWAISGDTKLIAKIPEERRHLNNLRAEQPIARSNVEIARRELEDYLTVNPQIQAF